MKKIIGILGVVVIAAVMFFSANANNAGNNVDLASLLSINTANAECVYGGNGRCSALSGRCYWDFQAYECDPWAVNSAR